MSKPQKGKHHKRSKSWHRITDDKRWRRAMNRLSKAYKQINK